MLSSFLLSNANEVYPKFNILFLNNLCKISSNPVVDLHLWLSIVFQPRMAKIRAVDVEIEKPIIQ